MMLRYLVDYTLVNRDTFIRDRKQIEKTIDQWMELYEDNTNDGSTTK